MGVFDEALRKRLEQQPAIDAKAERERAIARENSAHEARVTQEAIELFEDAAVFLRNEAVPMLPIIGHTDYPRLGEPRWRFLGFGWYLGRLCLCSDGRAQERPQVKAFGNDSWARSEIVGSVDNFALSAIQRQHLETSDQYIEVFDLKDAPLIPRQIQVNTVWIDESAEYVPTSVYLAEVVADLVARRRTLPS